VGFSDFVATTVIQEDSSQYDYVEFKVDREKDILLLFFQEKSKDSCKQLFVKIIDLKDKEKILLDCEIVDQSMKGIFKSGAYKLINGHIYSDNKVIKLRYDLMKHFGANGLN
jgi:hypothetical protein